MEPSTFYGSVCACSNTSLQCPGIRNALLEGWPPRGFFTEVHSGPISLMAICKNPGHLLPDESSGYQGKSPTEVASVHLQYAKETFAGLKDLSEIERRSTTFHKNLIRYVALFLGIPAADVFKHFVYTNLVKCSTFGERDLLHVQTMRECFVKHLQREIQHFRPSVLIAFGREVERFLLSAREAGLHQLPVVYVKHPSYYYRRDQEEAILRAIKATIDGHLKITRGESFNVTSTSTSPSSDIAAG